MKPLLALTILLLTPLAANAGGITSKITDSVQLSVQGAAVQSTRIGASYDVSGTNITSSAFGGTSGVGTYAINTSGQAFTFSESFTASDALVTNQTWSAGAVASPNLYGDSVTQLAGDKGSLAGTLSGTGVPTITAGGPGSTGTAQRTIELSVFK